MRTVLGILAILGIAVGTGQCIGSQIESHLQEAQVEQADPNTVSQR